MLFSFLFVFVACLFCCACLLLSNMTPLRLCVCVCLSACVSVGIFYIKSSKAPNFILVVSLLGHQYIFVMHNAISMHQ
jgi:hypothetical protein